MKLRDAKAQTPLILPVGTHVVARVSVPRPDGDLPAGAVGEIVEMPVDPTHAYRVRFPDGAEVMLRRSQLAVRKHVREEGLIAPTEDWDLTRCCMCIACSSPASTSCAPAMSRRISFA